MHDNRGGGSHHEVVVKPPSVLSRGFTPTNNNLLPMSLDDMIDKTLGAGLLFGDINMPSTSFVSMQLVLHLLFGEFRVWSEHNASA